MLQGDNYTIDNATEIRGKIQKTMQNLHRSKPAVPTKPTNIPPIPQQIYKDTMTSSSPINSVVLSPPTNTTLASSVALQHKDNVKPTTKIKDNCQSQVTATVTEHISSKKSTKSNISVPTSPNISFGNDCCGMLLSSSSKNQQDSSQSCNNNNYSSISNDASEFCREGPGSCIASAGNKIAHSCGLKQSPTESVDASSTVSSHSGGFRDPEFTMKQAAYVAINAGPTTTTSASQSPKKAPPTMQKLQFNPTAKQIEHILAQRLSSSSASSSVGASVNTNNTSNYQGCQSSTVSSTGPASMLKNKKRMSISYNCEENQSFDSSNILSGSLNISKHLQTKLQEEMKQQCKIIQDKHLIERRPPQQYYKPSRAEDLANNRNQLSAELRQNPRARTSVFGAAPSDKFPKENINRKGLPQTTATCIPKCDDKFISSSSLNQESQREILETDDNALVYRDGNLISGSLETLIQHMVPTSDYYPDKSYIFAFLLSARLFIRPYELLAKICQLCDEQQNFTSKSELQETTAAASGTAASSVNALPIRPERQNNKSDERLQKFARHLVQLLAEWIGTFPYDFRDERVMQHVRSMTRKCINIDNELKKDVSTILQELLHRLTVLEKYEEFLQSLARYSNDCFESQCLLGIGSNIASCAYGNASGSIVSDQSSIHQQQQNYQQSQQLLQQSATAFPTSQINSAATSSSSLNSTSSVDISEMCSSPNHLASQLTHIELERLSHIGPEEFVQAFAKENSNFEQSFNDIKRTRNLESYVQWFNRLSYLVATEIVKHAKKKQRVKIVEYWIETARECFNIGNFNSLMAIIAGLNMSPISRLKKTWAKVQSAKFAVLEHQMDPSSNFNSYRSTLKAAMWRSAGATDERERIVIPFFSLLVKDLYFLNEGCSNKLPNGHINFEKFWQLAKQVTEFIAWKQVTCPFEKLPKVIMFLQTNNVFNENTLALASFDCEPPENHEKDRYKCLKSEQQQQQQNSTHQ